MGQLRCYEESFFGGARAFESFAVNDYHRKQSTSLFCNFDVNDHPSSVRGPLLGVNYETGQKDRRALVLVVVVQCKMEEKSSSSQVSLTRRDQTTFRI